jgi:hypothetical protein
VSRSTFARAALVAFCLTGCGGFLGLVGDDEDDDAPPSPPVDAAADGLANAEGGNQVVAGDAAPDVKFSASDASVDAPKDATVSAFACNGKAACERYVFVTSTATGGSFSNTLSANARCQQRADSAGSLSTLKGRSWRAWVSTSTKSALQNLEVDGTMPYRLVDNSIVATSRADLVDGDLLKSIDLDETGAERSGVDVWTATGSDGAYIAAGCNGFTAPTNDTSGKVGKTSETGAGWTNSSDRGCAAEARLYCFEF